MQLVLSFFSFFSRIHGEMEAKKKWYFVSKTGLRKKCSIDSEKLLKFKAEGQELAKSLRSLELNLFKHW